MTSKKNGTAIPRVHLHLEPIEETGKRFVTAFNRAKRGEIFRERHVSFVSIVDFTAALSPKRVQVLQEIRKTHYDSVLALAKAMGRDYKRTYQDVATLEAAGLVQRDERGLSSPWKRISADIVL